MTGGTSAVAGAYSATGRAWQDGPGRIYDHLAEGLVARCPTVEAGAVVLDLGEGTGAVSRSALGRGARVVAVDAAEGMLATARAQRPAACVGDALALPFRSGGFDAVVAAFSLNHVAHPAAALREAARVLRPGGALVASAYAEDDTHPVKGAAEAAAAAAGWVSPAWYEEVRAEAVPRLATVDRARAVVAEAGLAGAAVAHVRVPFTDLGPADLVAWRFGMAQLAPFLAGLDPARRDAVVADARARLGDDPPPLVRSIIVIAAPREIDVLGPR